MSAFPAAAPAPLSRPSLGPDLSPRPGGRRDAALTNPPGTTRRRTPRPWLAVQAGGRRGSELRVGERPPAGDPEKRKRREKKEEKKKKKSSVRLCHWACSVRRALPRAGSARRVLRAAAGAGPGWERRAAKRGLGWGSDAARRGDHAGAGAPTAVLLGHFLSCTRGSRASRGCLMGRDTDPAAPGRCIGDDATSATFGAVQPNPFCTRADCCQGRLHSPGLAVDRDSEDRSLRPLSPNRQVG